MAAPVLSSLRFASFKIPNQVFYLSASRLTFALVNLKPLVPGHVLVVPTRVIPRFADLTPDEVSDLFSSVHAISKVIEKEYKAQALNIALQDGPLAGQSVPHVHVHIIPRRAKDFEPIDEMYSHLDALDLSSAHSSFASSFTSSFASEYASRPTRAQRKEQEALERERLKFEAEAHAKATGNVETPFAGIEDERKPRGRREMREEAERLSRLFPEENRAEFTDGDGEE
ncbi:hypothetical protein JCM8547_009128 [Rhodosporidiobolus lusitaniae]